MFILPDLRTEEIIMYLRKSRTDDPALTVSETVAIHEKRLDDYCMQTFGAAIPEQNRFREIVSGETIEARPEIKKVLRLIERDRYKAILIVEPQRLSRGDLQDIGYLSKILRYTCTIVITPQYSFDLSDERDRDYFQNELKRGNEYLEYQKRIMGNGRLASVERGNYLGTVAPYGYNRIWIKEGKKKAPTLEINPKEAEVVKTIFRMYADHNGASAICKHLNAIGIPARSAKAWKLSTIYTMLDNPVYIGMVRWQSTKEIKQVVAGEIEKQRQKQEEYPLFQGKHDAIIDRELWDAVRSRRKSKDIPRTKTEVKQVNPFAGLVRCECGEAVVLVANIPKVAPRMRCVQRHVCGCSSCRYQDFVQAVSDAIKENIENLEAIANGDAQPDNSADIAALKKRLDFLTEKEKRLWEKYAEGMPPNIFDELLQKTQEEQKAVESLLASEMEKFNHKSDLDTQIIALHGIIDLLPNLNEIPVKEANKLLKSCIRQITYSRKSSVKKTGGNRGGWNSEPINLTVEFSI